MEKRPFVTKEKLEEIAAKYPTPFHLYDEKGIRENARRMNKAFSWNKGSPRIFCGQGDTQSGPDENSQRGRVRGGAATSYTELMLSDACRLS